MNSKQLENWADELIFEYEQSKKGLQNMKKELNSEINSLIEGKKPSEISLETRDKVERNRQDKSQINSMIDSMTYSVDWLKTGRQPDNYRGIDKHDAYRFKQYEDMDIIPDITEQLERESLNMNIEQKRKLLRLFRSFSDRERQCYIMHEAEQLSMQQIADKLGVSKGTVQNYLKRAKEKVNTIAS